MRTFFSLLLALVAMLSAAVGVIMPLTLPAQAARNREYYEHFKAAAAHIDKNGNLPANELGGWRNKGNTGPLIRASLKIPIDCDPSFTGNFY